MARNLTDRQIATLRFIAINQPTTFRAVGEAVGVRSTSTVFNHLQEMQRMRLVEFGRSREHRTIRLTRDVVVSQKGDVYRIVASDDTYFEWRPRVVRMLEKRA